MVLFAVAEDWPTGGIHPTFIPLLGQNVIRAAAVKKVDHLGYPYGRIP
jgi:hypothetical protein